MVIAGCKEEYNPPLKNAGYNYLVVEGNILAGNDSTFVHLTRTVDVADTSNVQPELNATVKVESENGEVPIFAPEVTPLAFVLSRFGHGVSLLAVI